MNLKSLKLLIYVVVISLVSCQEEKKEKNSIQEYEFNENHWRIENPNGSTDSLKIMDYQGRQAIPLKAGQKAILKYPEFKNFVVEFYCNGQVPGFGFRTQDLKNYEHLYLRMMMSGKQDALQYVPIHNGNLPWQLYNYPQYEGNATFPRRKVASIPISMKEQLINGKASDSLIIRLGNEGVKFSEESFVDIPDESPAYIYDPQNGEALLFEIKEDRIDFLDFRTWVRVKVEVFEDTMSVYVEDMDKPSFTVDNLKRDSQAGKIGLFSNFGDVYFSDFSISEIDRGNNQSSGNDAKQITPNYITNWHISGMFAKDSVNFLQQADSLLKHIDKFKDISADEDGLVNISRFYDDMDKTVIIASKIVSSEEKEVVLNFDYADHLAILMNSEMLFNKGMNFRPPIDKGVEGRVFVNDEQVKLKLQKGINWLAFILSGDNRQKYNWGYIAKLEDVDGITLE